VTWRPALLALGLLLALEGCARATRVATPATPPAAQCDSQCVALLKRIQAAYAGPAFEAEFEQHDQPRFEGVPNPAYGRIVVIHGGAVDVRYEEPRFRIASDGSNAWLETAGSLQSLPGRKASLFFLIDKRDERDSPVGFAVLPSPLFGEDALLVESGGARYIYSIAPDGFVRRIVIIHGRRSTAFTFSGWTAFPPGGT
jgi:hypothetical protein